MFSKNIHLLKSKLQSAAGPVLHLSGIDPEGIKDRPGSAAEKEPVFRLVHTFRSHRLRQFPGMYIFLPGRVKKADLLSRRQPFSGALQPPSSISSGWLTL